MNWLSSRWRLLPGSLAALAIALLLQLSAFQSIEQIAYRSLFQLRGAQAWDDRIVLVAIDDASLRQLGRFPISRQRYTDLINRLSQAQPSVIVFDLVWSEASRDDASLAESIANYGRVVLAQTWDSTGLPLFPVPTLRNAAIATGHIRKFEDSDGLVRHVEPQINDQPALWLAAMQAYSLVQAEVVLPTQPHLWLNWPSSARALPQASLADVLANRISADRFRDKIVIVGVTATAIDTQRTPFDMNAPASGTIVQAAAMHNTLRQNFLQPIGGRGLILLLGGPILGWLISNWQTRRQLGAIAALCFGWGVLSVLLFRAGYWLPTAMPIALFTTTAVAVALNERLRENALLARQVDRLWQTYQPDLVARDPMHPILQLQGRQLQLSSTPRLQVAQLAALADLFGRSQSMQAAIARSLSIGLVAADCDGRVWFCNPTAIGWLNLEVNSNLAAKLIPDWLSQSEWDADFTLLQRDRTIVSRTLPRSNRWFSLSLEPLSFNSIATLDGFLLLLEDISDRKQAEVALGQAKDAAISASRAKGEFLANMSHELRTPLNAILGFAQLMQIDRAITPNQRQYLDIILSSGQHLLELINDVLDMSKIEAGRLKLNSTSFDLIELLDRLEAMLRLKAEAKQIQLQFELAANLPRQITTDEGKLRQVLLNLIGNALKFTESGRVLVCVESSEESAGALTLHFTIADTGIGIAPEEIDRLFEPFMQTRSGQMAQEGTGLGLAISRQFVQLMGGEIAVHSQINQGSVFQFTIAAQFASEPSRKSDQLEAASQIVGLAPGQPIYRLLIVEDQAANRQYLARLLSAIGFEVREAENGQEAIALWQHWQPHLILMDMRMPIMNGYETTRRIKASTQGQIPVIIAVTGDVFEEDQAAVLKAGCDDLIHKPVQAKELLLKLAQHLGVDYSYEAASADRKAERNRSPSLTLESDSIQRELAAMSSTWTTQLRQAAQSCSDRHVFALIEQIPAEQAALADLLSSLAADYRFSDILDLIIAAAKP